MKENNNEHKTWTRYRVQIKRIAIAKWDPFFYYRYAKEISFYYFRNTRMLIVHLHCWDYNLR